MLALASESSSMVKFFYPKVLEKDFGRYINVKRQSDLDLRIEALQAIGNTVVNHIPYTIEYRMQRTDDELTVTFKSVHARFGKGENLDFVSSFIDITEQKEHSRSIT